MGHAADPVPLTLAISHYDHVRDLTTGRVGVGGATLRCLELPVEEIFFRTRHFTEWDVAEMSLVSSSDHPYLQEFLMSTEDLTVGSQAAPVPAVVARPVEARGGVVVLQEAFGLTAHIRSICERLAAAGYLAVAPALYHRAGAPVIDYSRMDLARPLMDGLHVDGLEADIAASVAYLKDAGLQPEQIAVLGFCMGGSVALYASTVFALGAAVTFYGGGVSTGRFGMPPLKDLGPAIRCPWLGLFGAQDHTIPPEDVQALRSAVAEAPAKTELVCYPEAGHGFNCDERASFVPPAAADAWQRMLAFLDAYLGL